MHRLGDWVPVAVWALAIAVFSSDWFSSAHTGAILLPLLRALLRGASEATIAAAHAIVRKGAHVFEYAVLGALLVRAIRRGGPLTVRVVGLALLLAASWAAADELHQALVPSRTPASHDVAIDCAGAALGVALSALAAGRRRLTPRTAA